MNRRLQAAAFFILVAGVLGVLRLRQARTVIEAAGIRFTHQHSVAWDPATHVIRRVGDDPYVMFDLPARNFPVREFTIEFDGKPIEGHSGFYVYRYPAYLSGLSIDDSYVTLGKPAVTPGGFSLHYDLLDSKIVRLDLPDDLDRPIEIRRLIVTSPFNTGWAATAMWISLLAALGLVASSVLTPAMARYPWIEALAMGGLAGVQIWIAGDLKITFFGTATHDDALFMKLADSIMQGKWLGSFNELTLAKGPVYSLFLAAVGWSHVPLLLAQTLLYVVACAVFVQALRPLLASAGLRLLLFAVLLFDPHLLSSEVMGRVLRSGIQPALTLLTLGGFIGLAARFADRPKIALAWGAFAGAALACFWFSREEGVWLVPSIALVVGVALLSAFPRLRAARWRGLGIPALALPIFIFLALSWTLRRVNAHYYGAPVAVDVKDGAFPLAYGALVRIAPGHARPLVPVARETWVRAYAVSPAFAELKPYLEGPMGDGWASLSQSVPSATPGGGEIQGGWFQWAIRDAAARAGHYPNAAAADAYWSAVAAEINSASDRGLIAAGPRRDTLFPRWDPSYWQPLRHSLVEAGKVTMQFSDFSVQFPPMPSTALQKETFTRVTHEDSAMAYEAPTFRTQVRLTLFQVYAAAGAWAFAAGLAGTLGAVVRAARRRADFLRPAILLALFGGTFALMLVSALVDVTSFSAVHAMYLAPASALFLAGCVLAPAWARIPGER